MANETRCETHVLVPSWPKSCLTDDDTHTELFGRNFIQGGQSANICPLISNFWRFAWWLLCRWKSMVLFLNITHVSLNVSNTCRFELNTVYLYSCMCFYESAIPICCSFFSHSKHLCIYRFACVWFFSNVIYIHVCGYRITDISKYYQGYGWEVTRPMKPIIFNRRQTINPLWNLSESQVW